MAEGVAEAEKERLYMRKSTRADALVSANKKERNLLEKKMGTIDKQAKREAAIASSRSAAAMHHRSSSSLARLGDKSTNSTTLATRSGHRQAASWIHKWNALQVAPAPVSRFREGDSAGAVAKFSERRSTQSNPVTSWSRELRHNGISRPGSSSHDFWTFGPHLRTRGAYRPNFVQLLLLLLLMRQRNHSQNDRQAIDAFYHSWSFFRRNTIRNNY